MCLFHVSHVLIPSLQDKLVWFGVCVRKFCVSDNLHVCYVSDTLGYANTTEATRAKVRSEGQKVGWYTSGVPSGHGGLNWYVEYPAVRSRLLMGVAAWKQQSDFYIYYGLGGWSSFSDHNGYSPAGKPEALTPFLEVTDVRYTASSYDGEALLVLPGPKGMLSTIHFENLRDGLEE
eukprot:SAG22_NODE_7_length_40155_cov_25.241356_36_plen_176_part_00